ncbi:unnamed protein product [Withania somnifera]
MARSGVSSIALVLTLNILFFTVGKCPKDTLKLKVCDNLLNDLVHLVIGRLADLDVALCLCTAIKANVLGINLNVPLSLSLLLNNCGKYSPKNFQCA